ncbi:MAG: FtsB family cell division protein [Flavobacteriales bacterium]|jgi:cell division protein FtsB|tara:strand:- start:702 stop:1022 length:321 start_codon:yes stop_codon:yes gene_type:complete
MALKDILNSFKRKNKSYTISYIAIAFLFTIWILFLDSNSWLTQRELDSEIEKLEQQKNKLRKVIIKDQYTIDQLENLDSLERFAREHYGHKKDNETLFLIDTDSIK